MSFTDYGLSQILDCKNICFKPPKYAKIKLLIKFISNCTLIGRFTVWQFQKDFSVTIICIMIYK